MSIKVSIVEDDKEIRQSLKAIISAFGDLECVGIYPDAEQFLDHFMRVDTDVILMDINLPGVNGIEAVQQAKSMKPSVQFMMLTALEDGEKIFASLCAGATGYLLKHTNPQKLYESIKDIYQGGSPMSAQIARFVVNSFTSKPSVKNDKLEQLTEREQEILAFLSRGLRYKEIASKLNISNETVRTHIRNIYSKLQVHSRTDALNKLYSS